MAKLPGAIQGARIVGERYVRSQRQANPEGRMPLFDHLRELRNRVVKMALALVAGMVVGFVFFEPAWRVIERPLCRATVNGHSGCATPGVNQLILNSPLDPFYLRVKVAFIVGVIVSSPVWLYQLWAFIAPGLYAREKRWGRIFLGTAVPLFLIAGMANPSPDPITMLILGGACAALVEVAEFIVWRHDRRKARLHPDPYAGLADDELSPLDLDDADTRDNRLN